MYEELQELQNQNQEFENERTQVRGQSLEPYLGEQKWNCDGSPQKKCTSEWQPHLPEAIQTQNNQLKILSSCSAGPKIPER